MRTAFVSLVTFLVTVFSVNAQTGLTDDIGDGIAKYRRSSLYSVLIRHSSFPYSEEISSAFTSMPMPDKFNDHNLDFRSYESSATKMTKGGKAKSKLNMQEIADFFNDRHIAKKLIAKWFDRDPSTGGFDVSLIQERGFYDASQLDIASASESVRSLSALGDAGEELIGKTFVIVNDITFVDKGKRSQNVALGIAAVGSFLGSLAGDNTYRDVGNLTAALVNEVDGFRVNITTYLYRLIWDDETEGTFYQEYWFNRGEQDPMKKSMFDNFDIFKLEYVGETTTSAANMSSKSLSSKSKEDQMLRVCARAVDKSIVELQREYEVFKVNVPVYKISEDRKTVEVQIGLKEGINEKSQFEVLMPMEDENGNITYDKIGMIQPVKGMIWDNRFGAMEEAEEAQADNAAGEKDSSAESGDSVADIEAASLTATTFKILSGSNRIVPGCLVREVTIKGN